jgi:hypothetical protein
MFNILYKGRKLYQNLSHEECAEILEELSSEFYQNEDFDVTELELEEI